MGMIVLTYKTMVTGKVVTSACRVERCRNVCFPVSTTLAVNITYSVQTPCFSFLTFLRVALVLLGSLNEELQEFRHFLILISQKSLRNLFKVKLIGATLVSKII